MMLVPADKTATSCIDSSVLIAALGGSHYEAAAQQSEASNVSSN